MIVRFGAAHRSVCLPMSGELLFYAYRTILFRSLLENEEYHTKVQHNRFQFD